MYEPVATTFYGDSSKLRSELLAAREELRARDEAKVQRGLLELECRQLRYELQACEGRARLEVVEARQEATEAKRQAARAEAWAETVEAARKAMVAEMGERVAKEVLLARCRSSPADRASDLPHDPQLQALPDFQPEQQHLGSDGPRAIKESEFATSGASPRSQSRGRSGSPGRPPLPGPSSSRGGGAARGSSRSPDGRRAETYTERATTADESSDGLAVHPSSSSVPSDRGANVTTATGRETGSHAHVGAPSTSSASRHHSATAASAGDTHGVRVELPGPRQRPGDKQCAGSGFRDGPSTSSTGADVGRKDDGYVRAAVEDGREDSSRVHASQSSSRTEEQRDGEKNSKSSPSAGPSGAELFRRAEALCSEGRFKEAIPILEQTLRQLRADGSGFADQRTLHIAQADVWAHLGVALQSLDRLGEALASYGRAVALNPSLHACYANLAALHHHMCNMEKAKKHVDCALALCPENQAYLRMRDQICQSSK